jgi:hypothetical protein
MARKKSADQQAFSAETAPATARTPRANTVTHKHKKATPVAQSAEAQPVAEPVQPPAADVKPAVAPSHEEIAILAYHYWELRGCPFGSPEEDWFRAERELLSARAATA